MIEVDEYVGEYHEREDLGGGFAALETFTHLLFHILIYLKLLIKGIKSDPYITAQTGYLLTSTNQSTTLKE